MDPPPADSSGRRASGKGGRGRAASRLGMKTARSIGASPSPASPPAPPVSAPAAALPSTVPPRPPQAVGWGAVPPNVSSPHGNPEGPNSWGYPPGGFLNLVQQPHYPPQPQVQGENFHLVGQTMSFNPVSQSPTSAYGIATPEGAKQGTSTNEPVNIDTDQVDNIEVDRPAKKRYWTPEEEERLGEGIYMNPIYGVQLSVLWNGWCPAGGNQLYELFVSVLNV